MIEVGLGAAIAAGLLSFLSPCVLPLVPAYLSFISGASVQELREGAARRKALWRALWFVLGFSAVFVLLGASATAIGRLLLAHMALLTKLAGIVIVLFGLHFLGLLRMAPLMRDLRFDASRLRISGAFGAWLVGAAFAFGWTPCVGPILGAILAMAGMQEQLMRGVMLLSAYSLGLAIPFLLAAGATQAFLQWSSRFKTRLHWVEKVAGALLIVVGVLIFAGNFSELAAWLIRIAPWLANLEAELVP